MADEAKRKKKTRKGDEDGEKEKGLVIPANYKTQLCRNWEEEKRCPYGKRCVFAHDLCELRTIQINLVAMAHVALLRTDRDAYGQPTAPGDGNYYTPNPQNVDSEDPNAAYSYTQQAQFSGEYSPEWAQYYAQFQPGYDPTWGAYMGNQPTAPVYYLHNSEQDPEQVSTGPQATGEIVSDDEPLTDEETFSKIDSWKQKSKKTPNKSSQEKKVSPKPTRHPTPKATPNKPPLSSSKPRTSPEGIYHPPGLSRATPPQSPVPPKNPSRPLTARALSFGGASANQSFGSATSATWSPYEEPPSLSGGDSWKSHVSDTSFRVAVGEGVQRGNKPPSPSEGIFKSCVDLSPNSAEPGPDDVDVPFLKGNSPNH